MTFTDPEIASVGLSEQAAKAVGKDILVGRFPFAALGKALGMEPAHVDALARSMAWWDGSRVLDERVRELGLDPDTPMFSRLRALLPELLGL